MSGSPGLGSQTLATCVALTVSFALAGCAPCEPCGNETTPPGRGKEKSPIVVPSADAAAAEIIEVPDTGIQLGWGFNTFKSTPVTTICVEFTENAERAQTRYMTMHEVSDTYELMQRMGMSAEASVTYRRAG